MKIKTIEYGRVVQVRPYETAKLHLVCDLEPEEDHDHVLAEMVEYVNNSLTAIHGK